MATQTSKQDDTNSHIAHLNTIFSQQQSDFRQQPVSTAADRKKQLKKLKQALLKHQNALIEAMNQDFGNRSTDESLMAEIMPSIQNINYAMQNVAKWMKPEKRHVSLLFQPASNRIHYQPLGVVGIIVPWNYPLFLAVGPLVSALSAGNPVMIKMSEFTPATAELFQEIIHNTFPIEQVCVITGNVDVARAFSSLPWGHLLFTGSTAVGHHVMRAAAENLTPVTLELGGKSPAIIGANVPMKDAAQRLAFGKALNAGQTCVAPDYILCPTHRIDEFIEAFTKSFNSMYPTLAENSDFTSIINKTQYERLQTWLADAKVKGARVIEMNPANETFTAASRKMPIYLLLDTVNEMTLMQEEIFGPLLPILPYETIEDALEYIAQRPHPLALYYFGYNKSEQDLVLNQSISGGMCINDTLMHVAQDDMPFGGVGPSGMGAYHGKEGFITFSNAKSVHSKQRINSGKVVYPPHGSACHKLIYSLFIR